MRLLELGRRRVIVLLLAVAEFASILGCSKVVLQTGKGSLDFTPKFAVTWPDTPREASYPIDTAEGILKTYVASVTKRRGDANITFEVRVAQYPNEFKLLDPKKILDHMKASKDNEETSRREMEHGLKKHPGLEITGRRRGKYYHRIIILADRTLYEASVFADKENLMEGSEARVFLASFSTEGDASLVRTSIWKQSYLLVLGLVCVLLLASVWAIRYRRRRDGSKGW